MALVVDASVLYAQADANEPRHAAVATLIKAERGPLVTSELAVAEADYLILDRLGVDVELAFLEDLAAGTFVVECLSREELEQAKSIVERYRDLRIGLADASLVVIAARYRTTRIATFDERAFRTITPLTGEAFTLLPIDSPEIREELGIYAGDQAIQRVEDGRLVVEFVPAPHGRSLAGVLRDKVALSPSDESWPALREAASNVPDPDRPA